MEPLPRAPLPPKKDGCTSSQSTPIKLGQIYAYFSILANICPKISCFDCKKAAFVNAQATFQPVTGAAATSNTAQCLAQVLVETLY